MTASESKSLQMINSEALRDPRVELRVNESQIGQKCSQDSKKHLKLIALP